MLLENLHLESIVQQSFPYKDAPYALLCVCLFDSFNFATTEIKVKKFDYGMHAVD